MIHSGNTVLKIKKIKSHLNKAQNIPLLQIDLQEIFLKNTFS